MKTIYTFNNKRIQELHTLYENEWWTNNRTFEETTKCIAGSQLCIGIVDDDDTLQGFARVLTDYVFKAIIFDLIVSADQRGTGIGNTLMTAIKNHQQLKNVKRFELYCLPEVFNFYEQHGFSSDVGKIKLMRYENA